MLALLSPAKNLDLSPADLDLSPTTPALMDDAQSLMKTTRNLSQKKIRELMKLSPELAKLNYDRYRSFELPFTSKNALPASLAFAGDVYRGLDARSLSAEDLEWAQDRVLILSGLYGVLRPLDLMQAYRLEMGTKLSTRRGKNLYEFWGDRIRDQIDETLDGHADPTLVNLASNEYFKAARAKKLDRRVVTCVFEDWKQDPNEGKVISFLAKIARGMMARYIISERIEQAEDLKQFKLDRYRFDKRRSTEDRWIFKRKFIPAGQK